MNLLLVNPRFPPSLWDFSHIRHIDGSRFPFPPLGLAVIAALTPPGHHVAICDGNIREIDFSTKADVVGITAYEIQKEAAFEIANAFRQKGITVALGGPLVNDATLDECGHHADALFIGEAELTWPRFIADMARAAPQRVYRQEGFPSLAASPLPRFDLLELSAYTTAIIETSRGCPFSCDFCEVPVRLGKTPRHKEPQTVMEEIKTLARAGAESLFIIDDNFTGNRKRALALLSLLEEYQRDSGHRLRFSCQVTLANAFDDELLSLLHRCGFRWVFIGLETPDKETLATMHKAQNIAHDLQAAIRNIQAHNLVIWGGIIAGFDADDAEAIERQQRFVMESGIPVVMASLLQALPGTPLHERLANEGRILDAPYGGVRRGQDAMLHSNIRHPRLTPEELADHYLRLTGDLYGWPAYAERLRLSILRAGKANGRKSGSLRLRHLPPLLRVLRHFCLTFDIRRVYHFLRVISAILKNPGLGAETVFMHLAVYIHLQKFHEALSFRPRP